MTNCQENSENLERSKIERLSIASRIGMSFHLSMCPTCRKYFKDSAQLDKWLEKRFKHGTKNAKFTTEEKEKLKELLGRN